MVCLKINSYTVSIFGFHQNGKNLNNFLKYLNEFIFGKDHTKIVELLLNSGADAQLKDIGGKTARDIAVGKGKSFIRFFELKKFSSENLLFFFKGNKRIVQLIDTEDVNSDILQAVSNGKF